MNYKDLLKKPSFMASGLNGLLVLIVLVMIVKYYVLCDKEMDTYTLMTFLLLLSIAIGIHGLMHLGLEAVYKYNPLE